MRPHLPWLSKNCLALSAAAVLSAGLVAACSSSVAAAPAPRPPVPAPDHTKAPITIGASLSLTGDFSADGQAFERGYQLWASDVNAKGGMLGRQVKLKILNDNSSPTQVVTNYQTCSPGPRGPGLRAVLLAAHHAGGVGRGAVRLRPDRRRGRSAVGLRYPVQPADHNVFDVSLPIADEMVPVRQLGRVAAAQPAAEDARPTRWPTTRSPTRRSSSPRQSCRRSGSRRCTRRSSRRRSPPTSRRPTRWPRPARRPWCSGPPTCRPWPRSCRRSSSSTTTPRCSSARRVRTRAPRSPPRWARATRPG